MWGSHFVHGDNKIKLEEITKFRRQECEHLAGYDETTKKMTQNLGKDAIAMLDMFSKGANAETTRVD